MHRTQDQDALALGARKLAWKYRTTVSKFRAIDILTCTFIFLPQAVPTAYNTILMIVNNSAERHVPAFTAIAVYRVYIDPTPWNPIS